VAESSGPGAVPRPPWHELESLRPLTLSACRRLVVVAPHPRDEIRAAGGLLRRLAGARARVDVLSLTDPPTRTCTPPEGVPVVPDVVPDWVREGRGGVAIPLDPAVLADLPDPDGVDHGWDDADDDPDAPDGRAAAEEAAASAAYASLGLTDVHRHRLGLPDGGVRDREADVVAAISEIVGFADDPAGLCVLAPWSGDGDDDHEAAGRAAEVVTAAYRVRLVRWLDQAWRWAGPDSAEVPWRRARQVALSETVLARKLEAVGMPDGAAHDPALPQGSAPGPREVFLV
jgi:LmbE family N-acetylglucosaminyl deacetylase